MLNSFTGEIMSDKKKSIDGKHVSPRVLDQDTLTHETIEKSEGASNAIVDSDEACHEKIHDAISPKNAGVIDLDDALHKVE